MAKVPFRSEQALLAKFENWLAGRKQPPDLFEVMKTGDVELIAAFVLKSFRAASQKARDRVEGSLPVNGTGQWSAATPIMRVFAGLSKAWDLSVPEQLVLLGLRSVEELERLKQARSKAELPPETLERLSLLVGIFAAINTLLPEPAHADAWMRRPNMAPLFGGASALDLMVQGPEQMRKVRAYLDAEVAGN